MAVHAAHGSLPKLLSLSPGEFLRSSTIRQISRAALVGLVYFLLARLSVLFLAPPEELAVLWPPAGYFLGILLITRRHDWPLTSLAVMAASWLASVSIGILPLVGLAFALARCVAGIAGAWALVRFAGPVVRVDTPRGVVSLGVLAAVAATTLTGLIGGAVLMRQRDMPFVEAWRAWRNFDGLGILIVTPLVLTWPREGFRLPAPLSWRAVEMVLVAGGVLASGILAFAASDSRTYFAIPLMIWAAMRFGPRGAAWAMAVVSVIAAMFTLAGSG